MMIVVPTARATEARSWLAMPNIGRIVLMLLRPDEIGPREHDQQRRNDRSRDPLLLRYRVVELPEEFLHQESCDARVRVDRGEDKERLEHDREVIPVVHQPAHARA